MAHKNVFSLLLLLQDLELHHELPHLWGEFCGCSHFDRDYVVAFLMVVWWQFLHARSIDCHLCVVLSPWLNSHNFVTQKSRDNDLIAQNRLRDRDVAIAVDVTAFSLEQGVRPNFNVDYKVTCGTPVPCVALLRHS